MGGVAGVRDEQGLDPKRDALVPQPREDLVEGEVKLGTHELRGHSQGFGSHRNPLALSICLSRLLSRKERPATQGYPGALCTHGLEVGRAHPAGDVPVARIRILANLWASYPSSWVASLSASSPNG